VTRESAPARLLADLAALGPYFAVDVHRPGAPLRPPWQSLGELIGSPDGLAARIGEVRERLAAAAGRPAADVEFRVAASIAQLGLCARLLSPALGAAALGRALPVDTAQARWVPALGGPFRLSLPASAAEASAAEASAAAGTAAIAGLLAGPVAQIVRAVQAMAVSPQVLWGNVASAVNGAATMIAAARPQLADAAAEAAAAVLTYPALTGTYQGRPLAGFRRGNCCLIYRLSPERPAYCGDCVLARPRWRPL
jgi:FhuF-like iron-sulfur protein